MIGHWFKKKKTECTAEDVRFLCLLCMGRPPQNGDEVSPHIGQGFFATLKLFLGKQEVRQLVLARLRLGKLPPHAKLEEADLAAIAEGLKTHFRSDTFPKPYNWLTLLAAAFSIPRFKRAFLHHYSDERFEDIQASLAQLPAISTDMVGKLLSINGLECRGIALDRQSPDRPVTLDFFLNGLYVGTTRAELPEHQYAEEFEARIPFGFTHTIAVPPALKSYDQLSLSIFEKTSGVPVIIGKELLIHPVAGMNQLQRLNRNLELLRKQAKGQGALLEKLAEIESQLPRLEKLGSFSLDQYDQMREIAPLAAPKWSGSNDSRFDILIYDTGDADALEATLMNIEDQSYPAQSVIPVGERGTLSPASAFAGAISDQLEGTHLLFLQAGDMLEKHGLAWFAAGVDSNPDHHLYYADYEMLHEGALTPCLQARLDYDLLLQKNTLGRAFAVEKNRLTALGALDDNSRYDFHHYLLLRHCEVFGETGFQHIPQVLMRTSEPAGDFKEGQNLLTICNDHFARRGLDVTPRPHTDSYGTAVENAACLTWPIDTSPPKLAIIIPTKDRLELIKPCVESLLETLDHPESTGIVILDNGSSEPQLLAWFEKIQSHPAIQVIRSDTEFNWSALNNLGARNTDADYLLFLNDDTLALDKGWDSVLRGHLARDSIGAIGARLLYRNGTIQHAGMIFYSLEDARHEGMGSACDAPYPQHRTQLAHACSAVTGAFLACRRQDFDAAGGFDEAFAITYNDVDFCFKIRQQGRKILYEPQITFQHFQSESRGKDARDSQKLARARKEANLMRKRWLTQFDGDPYYPKAYARSGTPFSRLSFTETGS